MRNHSPAVIRVESPLRGEEGYPVEVGAVLHNGAAYCFLVQPTTEWTGWETQAAEEIGLTRSKVERHGLSPTEVADALNRALRDEAVYSTKPEDDNRLLDRLYESAGTQREFHVEPLYELLEPGHREQWEAARDKLSSLLESERHRASNVARLEQQTFRHLLGSATPATAAD